MFHVMVIMHSIFKLRSINILPNNIYNINTASYLLAELICYKVNSVNSRVISINLITFFHNIVTIIFLLFVTLQCCN